MIQVKQHRPAFFSGFLREQAQCEHLDGVLALLWIERWAQEANFDYWAQSPLGEQTLLMAIMRDGKHWVVAYLTMTDTFLDLPVWLPR